MPGERDAVDRFVERFSALLVDGGMPRMPARVFSRVLAEDSGQLTAGEIAERLSVDEAAVAEILAELYRKVSIRRAT